MKSTKVIIIGSSHHNTYGMVRCFGEYKVKPILVLYGCNDSYILRSRYVCEHYLLEQYNAIPLLLQEKIIEWSEAVIIPCTDDAASILDKHYSLFKDKYHFFNCGKEGSLTYNMNKLIQTQIAKESGLEVPASTEGNKTDLIQCIIPFPRILKPLESIHGGKHIMVCHDSDEYFLGLNKFGDSDNILVQEFIKKEQEIVVLGLSIGDRVVIPGFIHKFREIRGGTTFSCVKDVGRLPDSVVEACKKLVNHLAYEGCFGIELIVREDKYYFVEINLRNDATTFSLATAGFNLPLMYYNSFRNGESAMPYNTVAEIYSIVDFVDLTTVKGNIKNFIQWLKDWLKADCHYQCTIKDPMPFIVMILQMIKKKIK